MSHAELIVDARNRVGESPVWHATEQALYWVDITRGSLHRYHPATGASTIHVFGQEVGCAVPRRAGGWVVGLRRGIAAFDPARGEVQMLADPESATTGNR